MVQALALNHFFGNNPAIANRFIKYYGSIEAISNIDISEILVNKFSNIYNGELLAKFDEEYKRLINQGYRIIPITSDEYPSRLKNCPDAPYALYLKCECEPSSLFERPAVSIVGTRDMTLYGQVQTRRIVESLSKLSPKPLIVSGLAYGIDITAHLAALEYGLPTVGVSPVGIDKVYPSRHKMYVERIVKSGGAIVSDFPTDSILYQSNFLRRNRIIAGLSDNTILIESKIRGGGLMTARLASEYSRGVFALPGRIDDIYSQGCNELISKNIAASIPSTTTLIEILGFPKNHKTSTSIEERIKERFAGKEELEILLALVTIIKKRSGISLDELSEAGNMDISEISSYIAMLEKEAFVSTDLLGCCSINNNC